jgi:Ca2+-binding RTX toxin-like protein
MMADLFGNNLANNLTEGVAADNILGAGGNDTLTGGGGNHSIYGDWANDSLNSGVGEDFMYGGEGNDALNALEADIDNGIGDDVYIEESNDTLNAIEAEIGDAIVLPLATRRGDDRPNNLIGTPEADTIFGFGGNDTINGRGGNDHIDGGWENDRIYGGSGNDSLDGGPGNDILNGGPGNDTLTDRLGSNEFHFNTPLATAGVDRITDFSSIPTDLRIPHDKIVLDKSVFSALDTRAGNVLHATDFAVINVAAAAEVEAAENKGNEIVYNRRTGNLFYNPNNNAIGFGVGGGRFATIVGSPDNLSNRDFLVVA